MDSYINILHRTPFFRLLLPFILGIISVDCGMDSRLAPLFLIMSLLALLLYFLVRERHSRFRHRWIFGFGVSLLFFVLGMFFSSYPRTEDMTEGDHFYVAHIVGAPRVCSNSVECVAQVSQIDIRNMSTDSSSVRAIVYLPKGNRSILVNSGDSLLISGSASAQPVPSNPGDFDSKKLMLVTGAEVSFSVKRGTWVNMSHKSTIGKAVTPDGARNYLLELLEKKE